MIREMLLTVLFFSLASSPALAEGYCYGNNGVNYHLEQSSAACATGEVWFEGAKPTTAQLQAAFTGYNAAVAVQQAQATYVTALATGLTVTSTGTPALNGTYAIDPSTQANITAEQVYIATKGTFTNGQATKAWPNKAGAFHTFPSTAAFTAFAVAVAQYVDALDAALATAQQGGTPTWPSANVTIQ